MIWGAPGWLNEALVYATKLFINLLYIYIPIACVYLIYKLFVLISSCIKEKKYTFNFSSNFPIIYLTLSVLLSFSLIAIYFKPQPIIPNYYKLHSCDVFKSESLITINSKAKLEELKSILNEYKCRRSLRDEHRTYDPHKAIEIYFIAFIDNGQMKPIHIRIGNSEYSRYSLGGIDFTYFIEDKDNTLREKLSSFIDSL